MFRTSERLAAAIAGIALVLTACTDPVFGPTAKRVSGLNRANSTSAHPALHSNSVKYRDNGAKPWTGRSGSASLTARVLVNNNGTADVDVSTGDLDSPTPAPGNVSKLQTKVLDGTTLRFVRNENGLSGGGAVSFNYPGIARGFNVQVQGNVRDLDPKRTDVVTVMAVAVRRPDLRAGNLQAPASAPPGVAVNVSATVNEINGDVGARGDCVLYVDGAVADRANGIWVDAGDGVNCTFTHRFDAPGTYRLEVCVKNVVPGDADLSNNAVSGSITIARRDEATMRFSAGASDYSWEQDSYWNYRQERRDGSGGFEQAFTDHSDWSHQQWTSVWGQSTAVIAFPIDVDLSVESGGATLHSAVFQGLLPDWTDGWVDPDGEWTYSYSQTWRADGKGSFYMEVFDYASQPLDYTFMQYTTYVYDLTYVSSQFYHYWSRGSYDYTNYYYSSCDHCTGGLPFDTWGPDITLSMRAIDASAARFIVVTTVPLTEDSQTWDNPLSCYSYVFDVWNVSGCSRNRGRSVGKGGSVDGGP